MSLSLIVWCVLSATPSEVDFNRDVRPILSDKCYNCHGPDAEQREGAGDGLRLDNREGAFRDLGGYRAVVPGRPDESELIRRINSTDPDEVMPPASHRKALSDAEREVLNNWVRQGADWSEHWAFLSPQRMTPPELTDSAAARNWIDNFILDRLHREQLAASPPAERQTLLRRLSFDLVGLPPSPEELRAFMEDSSESAYEAAVDRLLASRHFGERMAMYWLDLVRYADSVGYHGDQPVSVTPYRDYVIEAFNSNLPFDRFTREQLAGDLLTEPTRDQLVASGYNRLGMMSAEGGVQPKEYLAKYASDRVRTASSVWLGTTLGCAECHDHKFDPFTSRDFYRFAAFFADIKERGLYSGAHASGDWGPKIEVVDDELEGLLRPIDRELNALRQVLNTPTTEIVKAQQQWEAKRPLSDGSDAESLPEEIRTILAVTSADRSTEQRQSLASYFRKTVAPSLESTRQRLAELEQQRKEAVAKHTRTSLVTEAVEPRTMRVLARGNWMDDTGEVVDPGVPHFLPQPEAVDRLTRLDLANWMTSGENPLTARVFVNRLWKMFFGSGLSKVLDDLGSQGEPPTHPELLDTLAVEFMESGWDVKHMVKLMVMSNTYRQSSMMRADLADRDPYNRLLARQSRFRLDAETIRDNALAVSGLLVADIGGPSARPYQPPGLYRHLNFPKRTYQPDTGASQYRRGIYVHWQRQFLHPAMKLFDAPSREECTAERPRSNTPLAALLLLNDPCYVEAARRFAEHAMQVEGSMDDRIGWMFQHALSRPAGPEERAVLSDLWKSQRAHYADNSAEAEAYVNVGASAVPSGIDLAELAAWTSVSRTLFNMHEFITRN